MTTFTPGQQLLVTDPDHPMFNRVGTYDFTGSRKLYLLVGHIWWPVDKDKVVLVETPEPPPYESEDQYTAAARVCACLCVVGVAALYFVSRISA